MTKLIYIQGLLVTLIILTLSCKEAKKGIEYDPNLLNIKTVNDTILHYQNFNSKYVDSRNVDVWLPSGYNSQDTLKYKVIYMHDGQNLFDSTTTWNKQEWCMDENLDSMIKNGTIKRTILVGIWNNGDKRFPEYMPNKPKETTNSPETLELLKSNFGSDSLLSDYYLEFLVKELKPFIQKTFNASEKPEDNVIMGSSMGGLISLYAICEYPDIFGGAGCISTHWPVPVAGKAFISQLESSLPSPINHRVYFDFGTKTLDEQYEPYQLEVDSIMRKRGYIEGNNWITKKFEGADHSERSWQARVHIPIRFLLQ